MNAGLFRSQCASGEQKPRPCRAKSGGDPGFHLKSLPFQKNLQTFAIRYLLPPIAQPDLTAMLHHISFGVADIERAARFYDTALAPLGYVRVWDDIRPGEPDQAVGYGAPGGGDKLAIKLRPEGQRAPGPGFHLALAAPDRLAVDKFHQAALSCGGRDNGAPGLRLHYGPAYYAAFVIDPDGHALEAVFNAPESC